MHFINCVTTLYFVVLALYDYYMSLVDYIVPQLENAMTTKRIISNVNGKILNEFTY